MEGTLTYVLCQSCLMQTDSRLSPLCCTEQHLAQETVMRMEPGPPSPPCRPVEPMFCRLMTTAQVMRLRTEPGPPSASVKLMLHRLCLMVMNL